jgi:nitroreductase
MNEPIHAGKQCSQTLDYLLKRRSTSIKNLSEPGPDKEQLETILSAASRVPDHGRLFPWYFMVFEGSARQDIGEIIMWAQKEKDPNTPAAKLELEMQRFMRAPTVVAVVSRIRKGKHPQWEQILSAGAACQNLCLAANALGFGTNWVTEWYSYNPMFRAELGLAHRDNIAGFIFIGSVSEAPQERERPELTDLISFWSPGMRINKGDQYDKEGFAIPEAGYTQAE